MESRKLLNRAYLLLASAMIDKRPRLSDKDDFLHTLSNPITAYNDMCDFAADKIDEISYYSIIRNYFSKVDLEKNIRVITAKYTSLCEKITGLNSADIAYVHGKLGWFEIPDKLEIFGVENFDQLENSEKAEIERKTEEEIFFPYVFIQSGIKPIVDEKQLGEYSKMLSFLKDADTLFIVGYRINIDDNHLNGIIRSYALKGKRILFLTLKIMMLTKSYHV